MRILENHKNKPLTAWLLPICLLMVMLVSGCLPKSDETQFSSRDRSKALIRQYSLSFVQYATQSLNAVSRSAAWSNRTLGNGRLTVLGIPPENSEAADFLDSGFCKDDSDPLNVTEYIITWFRPNLGTEINIHSLGTSQSGMLGNELRTLLPSGDFGIMRSGVIRLSGLLDASGSNEITLPASCVLPIPEGSPVIVFQAPQRQEPDGFSRNQEGFTVEENALSGEVEIHRSHLIYDENGALISEINETYNTEFE